MATIRGKWQVKGQSQQEEMTSAGSMNKQWGIITQYKHWPCKGLVVALSLKYTDVEKWERGWPSKKKVCNLNSDL